MSVQQKKKIFRYIFSLLALLMVVQLTGAQQQRSHLTGKKSSSKKINKQKQPTTPLPILRAITIQGDILSPFIDKISTTGVNSAEAALDINLKNKWFPVWELGYSSINHTSDEGGQFVAKGVFNRIGINVNLLNVKDPKQITPSLLFVGVRLGFAPFHYDIHDLPLTDEYWNTNKSSNLENLKASAKWGEIVAGIRFNVLKQISIGWSGRLKLGLSTGKSEYEPWYVPGYGINNGTAWGFSYHVGYTIPLSIKQNKVIQTSK